MIEAALEDTADGWRRAWKAAVDDGAPAHLAPYAGLRLAQHLVVSRERPEAREVLTSAAKLAANLGAGLLTGRITALAQRAGLSTESPTDGNPLAGLTARELEVLQLVADGKSNGEIGSALFISTKTASVHVSNILAKLGVNTRGEAAAIAHRRGLVGLFEPPIGARVHILAKLGVNSVVGPPGGAPALGSPEAGGAV